RRDDRDRHLSAAVVPGGRGVGADARGGAVHGGAAVADRSTKERKGRGFPSRPLRSRAPSHAEEGESARSAGAAWIVGNVAPDSSRRCAAAASPSRVLPEL